MRFRKLFAQVCEEQARIAEIDLGRAKFRNVPIFMIGNALLSYRAKLSREEAIALVDGFGLPSHASDLPLNRYRLSGYTRAPRWPFGMQYD